MLSITRIVAAAIAMLTLLPVAAAQASDQDPPPPPPKIAPLKPLEVKWVLRPGESTSETPTYMGWETVAHDDLTYPPPRHP